MFVAVGRGGRTITSCDDGQSWINDRQLTSNNGDHEEETDKGFAYGDGYFVQVLGWGAPASLQISEDGINWRRVYPEGSGWSTVAFLGDRFMMMNANEAVTATSPDGPWRYTNDHGCDGHVREGGGGGPAPGIMMGSCGATYTTDAGQTWDRASACSAVENFSGIGQRGGLAYGNGVFAAIDEEGDYCSTDDLGATWRSGTISSFRDGSRSNVGKMFFANGEFWMMVGNKAHRSSNGVNWSTTSFSPSGIILHAIAASPSGAYVAYNRESGQFYRSNDGQSWVTTTKVSATPTFQRLLFGYGRASTECPAP
jgi:photosystem II stability/assembly factor-like uncharacterized protein